MTTALWINFGDGPWVKRAQFLTEQAADVIGGCEAFDRQKGLSRWSERKDYEFYGPGKVPGSRETVALISDNVPGLVRRTYPLSPGRNAGPGAGPEFQGAKAIQVVGVRGVRYIFVHFVPSAGRSGSRYDQRRALHRDQMDALVKVVRHWAAKGPVVIMGDFNVNPSHDLMDPLRKLGLVQLLHERTHAKAGQPDHVWTNVPERITSIEAVPAPGDHKAVRLVVGPKRKARKTTTNFPLAA